MTLEDVIRERIQREGPITFEDFMDMALYWPGMGYYTRERIPFGPEGDYYTSAHLHPFFGRCIGVQVEECWELMGRPDDLVVVEVGPGMGYLAEGLLGYLSEESPLKGVKYILVERNPFLRQTQAETLKAYAGRLHWVSGLEELEELRGVIVMNEVVDALPVHLLEFSGGEYREVYVGTSGDALVEHLGPISSDEITNYIKRYGLPEVEGYRTEVNLRARELVRELEEVLREGFLIVIDYGYTAREYYTEERQRGTLLCYWRHQLNEDPYRHIGDQDITAHVNFTALRDWAEELGLMPVGFCNQGAFLVSLGIDRFIEKALQGSEGFWMEVPKIKGLLFGMGDSHRVLILYKGRRDIGGLRGFTLKNSLHLL